MTTITEISPSEIIPSSVHVDVHDKAKSSRRRRLDIKNLTPICQSDSTADQNGVVKVQHRRNPSSSESESSDRFTCESHGTASVMGRRREMEDSVAVELGLLGDYGSRRYDFFSVFDGHGGSHVADACRDRMHSILREEIRDREDTCRSKVDWEMVMVRCFDRMDGEVGGGNDDVEEMTVGSTVVTAVVGEEEVVIANCGDSRAVICRNGVAVPLSIDHKPDRPDELARIEAAGGRVINWNGYRVLGVLATSRSIGDHYLRPYVSPTPEVTISKRTEQDEFLILASDGLWDVISNELACQIVRRCLTGRIQRKTVSGASGKCSRAEIGAALLVELAMAKGSKDNISVIVVELRKFSRVSCS